MIKFSKRIMAVLLAMVMIVSVFAMTAVVTSAAVGDDPESDVVVSDIDSDPDPVISVPDEDETVPEDPTTVDPDVTTPVETTVETTSESTGETTVETTNESVAPTGSTEATEIKPTEAPKPPKNTNTPKTGDNLWLYIGIGVAVLAIIVIIIAVVAKKKKKA